MGRDRRGHRHGRRDAWLLAGPVRPQGAVRREGALDAARGAGHDSLVRCRKWPSRWRAVPQRPTTTPWPAPDAPPTRSKTSAGAPRGGSCRSSAAGPGGHRPSTAWSASDFSLAISLLGRTFATPAIPPCQRPGRSPTTRCGPGTPQAEKLLGVRGQPDPLRPEAAEVNLPAAPPFSADNQPLVDYLAGRGLHPYHLPMACDYTDGCTTCQGYLCDQSCKNDAARNCLLPAVAEHGAQLLTRMSGRAPGRRPHPGPASDLRASAPACWPSGQGGGAGRRCAGHPGAVAQFPVGRLAARIGQRLRLGGAQLDASSG